MRKLKALFKYITNPDYRFLINVRWGMYKHLSDEEFLKRKYKVCIGKQLNLENPRSFNEKIQWLKLYDRKPEYTTMVDKYAVKEYVAKRIGKEYIIPTLGVWDKFEDIEFNKLPEAFVLKCTHDSGSIIICKEKNKFDMKNAKRKLAKALGRNYYWGGREWPYKNVKPRIIAEPYMMDESGYELKDYKIFCFDGEPKIVEIDFDRFKNHKRNLYSTAWEYLNKEIEYVSDKNHVVKKPECLDRMLQLAGILSKDSQHVRCDFYIVNDSIYFGECTFYHESGFEQFRPEEFGIEMGSWIAMPDSLGGGEVIVCADTVLWVHIKDSTDRLVPEDYKVYCFNGKPEYVVVFHNRFSANKQLSESVYNSRWEKQEFSFDEHFAVSDKVEPPPKCLSEMLELSTILCKGHPQLRIDFYIISGKIYFGEITFYTASGFQKMIPEEMDDYMGKLIDL